MGEEIASLYATIGADASGFQSALSQVTSGLGGLGTILDGLSFAGMLGGAVGAAASLQDATVQLEQTLRTTSASSETASDATGHWATQMELSGPKADKMRSQLEMLNAQLIDHEARLGKAKGSHAVLSEQIDQEKEKIAKLTDELGINTAGQKIWIDGMAQGAQVTHMSEQALIALADGFARETKFSKETTMGAEDMLLTFKGIGKDVFPQATQATLDMAQMMGMSAREAALQLGKALNEPSKSLTNLRREGVQFDDQQTAMIKSMEKSGDLAGAQKIILNELASEFGGSATAAGSTFNGQLAVLGNTMQDVMATIGNGLLPVLTNLVGGIATFFQTLIDSNPDLLILAGGIGILAAGLAILPAILTVLGGLFATVIAPIAAVGLAAAGVYTAFQNNFLGLRDIVQKAFDDVKPIFDSISNALTYIFNPPASTPGTGPQGDKTDYGKQQRRMGGAQSGDNGAGGGQDAVQVPDLGSRIAQEAALMLPIIMTALQKLLKDVGDWITNTGLPAIGAAFVKLFNIDDGTLKTISKTVSDVWTNTVQPAVNAIENGLNGFVQSFQGIDLSGVTNILKIIGAVLGGVAGFAITVGGGVLKGIGDALKPFGEAIASIIKAVNSLGNGDLGGMLTNLAGGIKAVMNAIGDVAGGAIDGLVKFVSAVIGIDPDTAGKGWDKIKGAVGDAIKFVKDRFDELKGTLTKAFTDVGQFIMQQIANAIIGLANLIAGVPGMSALAMQLQSDANSVLNSAGIGPNSPGSQKNPTNGDGSSQSNGSGTGGGWIPPWHQSANSMPPLSGGRGNSAQGGVTISGPVHVYGVQNVDQLLDQLTAAASGRNIMLGTPVGGH